MLGAQQLFPGHLLLAQASSGAPRGWKRSWPGLSPSPSPGAWRTAQVGPGLPHPAALGPRDGATDNSRGQNLRPARSSPRGLRCAPCQSGAGELTPFGRPDFSVLTLRVWSCGSTIVSDRFKSPFAFPTLVIERALSFGKPFQQLWPLTKQW